MAVMRIDAFGRTSKMNDIAGTRPKTRPRRSRLLKRACLTSRIGWGPFVEAPTMKEQWRPVVGFEESYEISDIGRVRSKERKRRVGHGMRTVRSRLLTPVPHVRGGYLYVNLHSPSGHFHRKVHRLVCDAFDRTRKPGEVMRHLDGNPLNNTSSNLAWGTPSENLFDIVAHGRHHNAKKTRCKHGHPLSGNNLYVNATSGARQCRICLNRSRAKYAARQKEQRACQ